VYQWGAQFEHWQFQYSHVLRFPYNVEMGLVTDSSKEQEDYVILRNVRTVKKYRSRMDINTENS
jgi:hypothetical protein